MNTIKRDEAEKVFTQSAKSKHMRRSQALSRLWKNEPSADNRNPSPGLVAPSRQSKTSFEDREVITSNTRSIAALAARKRGKVNAMPQAPDKTFVAAPQRPLYRPLPPEPPAGFAPPLTSSRLEQHNQLTEGVYGTANDALVASDDNLSQNTLEKTSIHTETSLPPLTGGEATFRVKKSDPLDDNNNKRKAGYSQHYAKTQARRNARKGGRQYREQEQPKKLQSDDARVRPPSPGRRANARPRYRNQAAVNGVVSDSSAVSTPQTNNVGNKAAKKPLPTIPQYRKGNISVTGHGLPK